MITDPQKLSVILVTDCGSTTTKALLFEKTAAGWRHTFRGEAPTTVEEPIADVTFGAINAFHEIEELSGRKILASGVVREGSPFLDHNSKSQGIDLYLSTSSAGGGLQMVVMGVVQQMSAESGERAALGAGAIVLDTITADDRREDHEKIERIRHLRPDIVLLVGGVDGGSRGHVVEAAELLLAANPRPRFGTTLRLPVIYAGNQEATSEVSEILTKIADVSAVKNVRPQLEREDIIHAREAIHEFFLSHVMSHSPGYGKLLSWSPVPIVPTPSAVGDMVNTFARGAGLQVLCADIGGATTDVFSVFRDRSGKEVFNRTVSANYGMSYSIANVLVEAGTENISRWLPYELDESELRDRLRNKMIRPTSIPQTKEDLWLEQAVCREALRLSLKHHRSLAVGLTGIQQRRGIADIFSQAKSRYELVDLMTLDMVIGSGGVLSHAPHRLEAALMMLDGFELEGVTEIAVDSIFMMPHLGVLSSVHPEAAKEIFFHDCLVRIAHAIAPKYLKGVGEVLATVFYNQKEVGEIKVGEVTLLPLMGESVGTLEVMPLSKKVSVTREWGKPFKREITCGPHGLILDGRNRPMTAIPKDKGRIAYQRKILESLGVL